jgi:hypothetical protein
MFRALIPLAIVLVPVQMLFITFAYFGTREDERSAAFATG